MLETPAAAAAGGGPTATPPSEERCGSGHILRDIVRAPFGILLLEVPEDGPWIDAEVACRLGPVAAVQRQDFVYVLALKLLLGVGERQDRRQIVTLQIEVLRADERLLAEDDGLLQAVLELADVARPAVLAHGDDGVRREALHPVAVLRRVAGQVVARDDQDVVAAL